MTERELADEILTRYGPVTRGRGCFLYTKKGIRLTDMYQGNGRAILGWEGGSAYTRFKNILNRGISGFFYTEYSSQIHASVSSLLCSDVDVFFSKDYEKAFKAVRFFEPDTKDFWRPWGQENKTDFSALILLPPFPWTETIYMVCVKREILKTSKDKITPDSVILPSPLVAGITRSVYDLIAALQYRSEKNWFLYDLVLNKYFTRKGPYLYPKISEEKYSDFVKFCLDLGVVINPDFNNPSIVPFGADKGVFTNFNKISFE